MKTENNYFALFIVAIIMCMMGIIGFQQTVIYTQKKEIQTLTFLEDRGRERLADQGIECMRLRKLLNEMHGIKKER